MRTNQAAAVRDVAGSVPASASADRSGGVHPSNTPPQTLQTSRTEAAQAPASPGGGEDWFEVAVYLDWRDGDTLAGVADCLDEAQELSRRAKTVDDGWARLPGSGGRWKVHPYGCRLGDSARGPLMRWRFERDGVVFGLCRRLTAHRDGSGAFVNPSGFVRMSGDLLIAKGDARGMWAQVVRWFRQLGARVVCAKVSRVDMCVDLPGVQVGEFVRLFRDRAYTTRLKRSREETVFGEVFSAGLRDTGLRLGIGTLVRIYDKSFECRDLALRSWIINRRWGGVDQEHATRVEFQLRREFLKDCGIDTVRDYFRKRAALARYLTGAWFRFVDPDGFDRRHTERAQAHPLWAMVAERFAAWASAKGRTLPPMKRSEVRMRDLIAMTRGVMESAAARMRVGIDSGDDLIEFFLREVAPSISRDVDVPLRVAQKTRETLPIGG